MDKLFTDTGSSKHCWERTGASALELMAEATGGAAAPDNMSYTDALQQRVYELEAAMQTLLNQNQQMRRENRALAGINQKLADATVQFAARTRAQARAAARAEVAHVRQNLIKQQAELARRSVRMLRDVRLARQDARLADDKLNAYVAAHKAKAAQRA